MTAARLPGRPDPETLWAELQLMVQRQSTRGHAAGGSPGFASKPPLDLTALAMLSRFDWYDEDVLDEIERFIDGRHRMPAGDCWSCGQPVSAYADETTLVCPHGCPAMIDVAQNRREALSKARNEWLTAAQIERESTKYGELIKARRVRNWAFRGRITAREDGTYRLADVLRLAHGDA